MTTTVGTDTAPVEGAVEGADGGLAPPPERGATIIAAGVFERIAARAAAEVPGVEGAVQTGAGRFLPWTTGSPAEASVDVDHDAMVLDLTFNVAYPQPVHQVTERVRHRVRERLAALTGRRVQEINITVPDLVRPERRPTRVR